MMKILLVCSAGMSTSMLVKKMQESASEKNLEVEILAVGDADSNEELENSDIVMLGPQVRYLKSNMENRVENRIPVCVIDMQAYGTMNGAKVLDDALDLIEDFKK